MYKQFFRPLYITFLSKRWTFTGQIPPKNRGRNAHPSYSLSIPTSHSTNFPFFLFSSIKIFNHHHIFFIFTHFFIISIIKSLKFSTKPHPLLFLSFLMCFISVCYVNIFPVCTNILKFTMLEVIFYSYARQYYQYYIHSLRTATSRRIHYWQDSQKKKSPTLCLLIHILFQRKV